MKQQIPNIFTLLNLICGCIAITYILQNGITIDYESQEPIVLSEKMWMASLFIAIAAVVDFLDGFVARLFNATSEMGKQLDSLADVVSFGVAPSMIVYQFLRMSYAADANGLNVGIFLLWPAFIIAAAGAYRLARFNLDTTQSFGFKGVPIPAVGLLIASLPLIYWNTNIDLVRNLLINKWFLYTLVVIVSWLMVSTLPLMALKFKNVSVKDNLPKYILFGFALLAAIIFQWSAVPLVFMFYIIISLFFKNK